MRQFIRHPIDVPIEIGIGEQAASEVVQPGAPVHTLDISQGGLAVACERALSPGTLVEIRIPCVQPPFLGRARVAWCQRHEIDGFELGVTFLDDDDAFRARMVEQVCHIEDYRQSVLRLEGRALGLDEAALEWIGKFAAQFPEISAGQVH